MAIGSFKEYSARPVRREGIAHIFHHMSLLSEIPAHDLVSVGSTGKVDVSGDVDLAVNINKYDPEVIHNRLSNALGVEWVWFNKGTKVGSYALSISYETMTFVQVDLMYVNNTDWAKFAYFSPGTKSQYKGLVRNILLSSVIASINVPQQDLFIYNNEELIVRVGWVLDLNIGMKRVFQMRFPKKNSEKYVKEFTHVLPRAISTAYPTVEFDPTEQIIDDPLTVVQLLFGPSTQVSDVDTAEQVLELINKFDDERRKTILKIAKIRFREHIGKTPLPLEVSS